VLTSTLAFANRDATAYDVAPTLCALMGFPASSEMPGRSLLPTELPRIATYGSRIPRTENVKVNEEYYQNLKSLGYIK
jgi:arylsulfatase A-like enzyme